jgi:hypothetical protein
MIYYQGVSTLYKSSTKLRRRREFKRRKSRKKPRRNVSERRERQPWTNSWPIPPQALVSTRVSLTLLSILPGFVRVPS